MAGSRAAIDARQDSASGLAAQGSSETTFTTALPERAQAIPNRLPTTDTGIITGNDTKAAAIIG
jgi:hypothetical protein